MGDPVLVIFHPIAWRMLPIPVNCSGQRWKWTVWRCDNRPSSGANGEGDASLGGTTHIDCSIAIGLQCFNQPTR
jgi:hypothetical protein